MLNTFSDRLRVCRSFVGLSAKFIVEQVNDNGIKFSARQFSRWEQEFDDSKRISKEKVLDAIVTVFNEHGLPDLTSSWLLSGAGIPPITIDMSSTPDELKALYLARAMGDDYQVITVSSNYSEPFASPGDQIITRETVPEKLENKIALIKTKNEKLYLGVLTNQEKKIQIKNLTQSQLVNKANIAYCGKLTWVS